MNVPSIFSHHTLILRAIGAAIPVCLSLGLAIREALPCGPEGAILEVRTGSIAINDEVVPNDDSEGEVSVYDAIFVPHIR